MGETPTQTDAAVQAALAAGMLAPVLASAMGMAMLNAIGQQALMQQVYNATLTQGIRILFGVDEVRDAT